MESFREPVGEEFNGNDTFASVARDRDDYDSFLSVSNNSQARGPKHSGTNKDQRQTASISNANAALTASMTPDEAEIFGFQSQMRTPQPTRSQKPKNNQSIPTQMIGIHVVRQICNISRYVEVMNKHVLQYLCGLLQEWRESKAADGSIKMPVDIRITNSKKVLSIKSYKGDCVLNLPLQDPIYLQTHYIKMQPTSDIFTQTVLEVLGILCENFPGHLRIELPQIGKQQEELQEIEQHRRQVSCVCSLLSSISEESRVLKQDELHDVLAVLEGSVKSSDYKGEGTCLELIYESVKRNGDSCFDFFRKAEQNDPNNFYFQMIQNEEENERAKDLDYFISLIERVIGQDSPSKIASNIYTATEILKVLTLVKQRNEGFLSIIDQEAAEKASESSGVPSSTRMCVFQLAESNDIERITSILNHLAQHKNSPESTTYMVSKYHLTSKLQKIFKKYCNGEYGFDHEPSKNGSFQLALIQVTKNVLLDQIGQHDKTQLPFFEFLTDQTMDYIAQIVEESIINQHQNALQSLTQNPKTFTPSVFFKFISISLDIFQNTLCNEFIEFSQIMHDNLKKIHTRIQRIIQKRENPLMQNFIHKNEEETHMSQVDEEFYDLEQLNDLHYLSPELSNLAIRVSQLVQQAMVLSSLLQQQHNTNNGYTNQVVSDQQYQLPEQDYSRYTDPERLIQDTEQSVETGHDNYADQNLRPENDTQTDLLKDIQNTDPNSQLMSAQNTMQNDVRSDALGKVPHRQSQKQSKKQSMASITTEQLTGTSKGISKYGTGIRSIPDNNHNTNQIIESYREYQNQAKTGN